MAIAQGRDVLPVVSLQRRGTSGGSGLHRQQNGRSRLCATLAAGPWPGAAGSAARSPWCWPVAAGPSTSHQPPATAPKVPHGGRLAEVGGKAIVKRVGGLWPQLISFPNLLLAARRAAAGKRSRADVAAFLLDLEPQLVTLQRELRDGSYTAGPYRCFPIRDPKPRLISAAPFRDRVVHHALTQVLEPVFEGGADLQVCAGPPGPAPAQSRRAPLPLRAEVRCAQVFPLHRPPDPQRPAGARRKVPPYARSGRPHR